MSDGMKREWMHECTEIRNLESDLKNPIDYPNIAWVNYIYKSPYASFSTWTITEIPHPKRAEWPWLPRRTTTKASKCRDREKTRVLDPRKKKGVGNLLPEGSKVTIWLVCSKRTTSYRKGRRKQGRLFLRRVLLEEFPIPDVSFHPFS